MKIGEFIVMTSGLSVVIFSILIIATFGTEVAAKRGCSAFGHSCFGGHGKRSEPDESIRLKSMEEVPMSASENELEKNNEMMKGAPDGIEIQQLADFIVCRNCAADSTQAKANRNYMPMVIKQWVASYRRPYAADSVPNDN